MFAVISYVFLSKLIRCLLKSSFFELPSFHPRLSLMAQRALPRRHPSLSYSLTRRRRSPPPAGRETAAAANSSRDVSTQWAKVRGGGRLSRLAAPIHVVLDLLRTYEFVFCWCYPRDGVARYPQLDELGPFQNIDDNKNGSSTE